MSSWILIALPIMLFIYSVIIYTIYLLIKALRKYVYSKSENSKNEYIKKTLGETIRNVRQEKKLSQEFVAEALGVSRQAVSKWENGTSDPSTSNLIALSKLFDIPVEDLIKGL